MMMHWAINDWNLSPEACRPEGTQQIDDKAVQTPFKDGKSIHLTFPEADCPSRFALKPSLVEEKSKLMPTRVIVGASIPGSSTRLHMLKCSCDVRHQ